MPDWAQDIRRLPALPVVALLDPGARRRLLTQELLGGLDAGVLDRGADRLTRSSGARRAPYWRWGTVRAFGSWLFRSLDERAPVPSELLHQVLQSAVSVGRRSSCSRSSSHTAELNGWAVGLLVVMGIQILLGGVIQTSIQPKPTADGRGARRQARLRADQAEAPRCSSASAMRIWRRRRDLGRSSAGYGIAGRDPSPRRRCSSSRCSRWARSRSIASGS
jgi:hypothetical protein